MRLRAAGHASFSVAKGGSRWRTRMFVDRAMPRTVAAEAVVTSREVSAGATGMLPERRDHSTAAGPLGSLVPRRVRFGPGAGPVAGVGVGVGVERDSCESAKD